MTPTSSTTMRLDAETLRILDALAAKWGVSRSDAVRMAARIAAKVELGEGVTK